MSTEGDIKDSALGQPDTTVAPVLLENDEASGGTVTITFSSDYKVMGVFGLLHSTGHILCLFYSFAGTWRESGGGGKDNIFLFRGVFSLCAPTCVTPAID